jgi:hypothetical protein
MYTKIASIIYINSCASQNVGIKFLVTNSKLEVLPKP